VYLRAFLLPLALALSPGCILVSSGHGHHGQNDMNYQGDSGWSDGDAPNGGGGLRPADCLALEDQLAATQDQLDGLGADADALQQQLDDIDGARADADAAREDARNAAERELADALAAANDAQAAQITSIRSLIAQLIAEDRTDEIPAAVDALLAADEAAATAESAAWTAYGAALDAADAAWQRAQDELDQQALLVQQQLDAQAGLATDLKAQATELTQAVEDCWTAVTGVRPDGSQDDAGQGV